MKLMDIWTWTYGYAGILPFLAAEHAISVPTPARAALSSRRAVYLGSAAPSSLIDKNRHR